MRQKGVCVWGGITDHARGSSGKPVKYGRHGGALEIRDGLVAATGLLKEWLAQISGNRTADRTCQSIGEVRSLLRTWLLAFRMFGNVCILRFKNR